MAGESETTYSQSQLEALVRDGVQRETAALTEANTDLSGQLETANAKIAEQDQSIAGLEADKAAAEKAAEEAKQEFADFKAEQERAAELAQLTQDRVDKVKAAAKDLFDDDYYTAERAAKWAEMAEDVFETVLESISSAAERAGSKGNEGEDGSGADVGSSPEQARETAAFAQGKETGGGKSEGSTLRNYMAASGRLPSNV